MTYGYVRVSSITQNIERQMVELKAFDLLDKHIYIDKQSGKDFNRLSYQKLKRKLKKGDLLIIKSIDRLGRNYQMIIEEWHDLTKNIETDILVIDMPLLDTRNENNNLIGKFISDIVLQILSFVSENERETTKKRQAEGIKLAKLKGVHMGRPKYVLPDNFYNIVRLYKDKKISCSEASKMLDMRKSTFYKYAQ